MIIFELMATKNYCIFIKVGENKFMEKLLLEGEIYCKNFKFFREEEKGNLRHDQFDGAAHIHQINNIELINPETKEPFAFADSGQLYFHNHDEQGNIYCLYGIETTTLDLTSKVNKAFGLNMDGLNFGDTAVIIFRPGEFLSRIKKEVEKRGFTFHCSPITYYDDKSYQGKLSPFYKSKKYSLQNEIRFWIPNKLGQDLTFTIGDITDIAGIIPRTDISKLEYHPL